MVSGSPLHVGQINLPPKEDFIRQFEGIFERKYFTNHGPLVRELDSKLAEYFDVKHAVCVTNGTVALMTALSSLGLTGEVIVPAFTFPATVQSITWAGLTPVFCDVDPDTHMINADLVRDKITSETSAILPVHLWGRACDPDGLLELAKEQGLKLVFDAAHAVGCTHQGKKIGCFGDMECFSFHATKVLNAAEGGCITTNDDTVADMFRTARNFHVSETYTKVALRINGKMTEAQAAIGLLNLERLAEYIECNRERYQIYKQRIAEIPGIELLEYSGDEDSNFQYVVLTVNDDAEISRDFLLDKLVENNVLARKYFSPGIQHMPPYCDLYPEYRDNLPVTDILSTRLLQLPTGQAVSLDDVNIVCDLISNIIRKQ